MTSPARTPLVLIIRDGWGMNPHPEQDSYNAVTLASQRGLTPVADCLMREYPWTLIKTSGEDVGLPEGTMGNSEVGHQNIGAGRVVDQESVAITKACRSGLEKNSEIRETILHAKQQGTSLHLLGIASDAGVHGQLEHLFAALRACATLGLSSVFVHLFTDGRDTGPFTGKAFVERVEAAIREIGVGRIATLSGRYYAMDRDHRWERVRLAYDTMTGRASGVPQFASAAAAIQDYYDHPTAPNLTGDEFVTPRVIKGGSPIRSGDSVLFYNYRGDRPREITAAFVFPDVEWAKVKPSPDSGIVGFDRGPKLDLHYVLMTEYWDALLPYCKIAFRKPPKMQHILGEFLASRGLTQFRCAETEKYPHVTFFFNDYREEPFPGETRENPPSPKVATYDMQPEMSAPQVRDAVLRRLAAADCQDLIVVNFANGDMVGHTGVLEAAIKACAVVDQCVGAIIEKTLAKGGSCIVTADHGNCEQMWDPLTKSPHTAHTIYDVPLIVVSERWKHAKLRGDTNHAGWFDEATRSRRGRLADIAPTLLEMMGLTPPQEMDGRSLLATQ
jgi:2,3-bisphosphoglycerate-independent phosphoglycerate mutase